MLKCYICLPIAGREKDIFERAEKAKQEIIAMGFEPVSPLDLNKIGEEELKDHTLLSKTAWYMGRDIQMIIEHCDAIYCCEGWEYSKGCNVERECAKQYGRKILYQIPYDTRLDLTLFDAIHQKRFELCNKFCNFVKTEKQGSNSDVCRAILELINKFDHFADLYFDIIYNNDTHTFNFKEKTHNL